MKIHGILKSDPDININWFKAQALPIVSKKGELLGTTTKITPVNRAITDESVKLAMRAGLAVAAPQNKDENALTGADYLQLKAPFIKVQAVLMDHPALKDAIEVGNLFLEPQIKNNTLDKILLTISPTEKYTKIYLME